MAVEASVFGLAVLIFVLLIVLAGFFFYLMRIWCRRKGKSSRTSTDRKRGEYITGALMLDGTHDKSYKTTTDEESTFKLPTFEQILKQEERSALSQSLGLHPLKIPIQQPLATTTTTNSTTSNGKQDESDGKK